ncbi:MAG: ABC-F family ATP-binding cassette domain-containing protein, partial [Phaeodactylibacter sp.]|nr:ABC-F family ATP-binding cassette domain-containing protein [Phaeodactylibacter sp.]
IRLDNPGSRINLDCPNRAGFVDNSLVSTDIPSMMTTIVDVVELEFVNSLAAAQQALKKPDIETNPSTKLMGDTLAGAGIVGPNGTGKTTFLKLLTENIRTDSGKVVVGGNTVFGYYTQAGIQLKDNKRVIDVVQDIAEFIPLEKGQKLTAPQLLERFMFNRKQQQVYVSQLSGGERRRLYLLTVLMANPNFLILDEPTNDLDIMTLNVLEDFLLEFPGCVLIVSHDRYFMDKIVEHLFVFEGKGKIRDFPGSYTRYREVKKEEDREKARQQKAVEAATPSTPKPKSKATALSQEERKELKRLEKKILKLEEKKTELTDKFNDTSLGPEQITELSKELNTLNEELEEMELRWMELAEMA